MSLVVLQLQNSFAKHWKAPVTWSSWKASRVPPRHVDRGQGFNDYMSQECTGVVIVAKQTANFNRAEGLTVFENILQAQPEIDGTFAHNDEMILGAIEAAEAANRAEAIIFVGFDAVGDALQAVRDGKLAATIAQQPSLMGILGVDTAYRYLLGEQVERLHSSRPLAGHSRERSLINHLGGCRIGRHCFVAGGDSLLDDVIAS